MLAKDFLILFIKEASLITCHKLAICIQDMSLRSIASLLCFLIVCDSLSKTSLSSLFQTGFPKRFCPNQGHTPNGASWPQAMKEALWMTVMGLLRWKFLVQVLMEAINLQKFCTHLWSHGDRRWSSLPANHCFLLPEAALYGSSAIISATRTGMAAVLPGGKGSAAMMYQEGINISGPVWTISDSN